MKIVLFDNIQFDIEHKGQNKENKELYFIDVSVDGENINKEIVENIGGEIAKKDGKVFIRTENKEVIKIYD